jgi:hypothetical protein
MRRASCTGADEGSCKVKALSRALYALLKIGVPSKDATEGEGESEVIEVEKEAADDGRLLAEDESSASDWSELDWP